MLTIVIIGYYFDDGRSSRNVKLTLIGQNQLYGKGAENIEKSTSIKT